MALFLYGSVVRFAADNVLHIHALQQSCHSVPSDSEGLTAKLQPDFPDAMDPRGRFEDRKDIGAQGLFPVGPIRQPSRVGPGRLARCSSSVDGATGSTLQIGLNPCASGCASVKPPPLRPALAKTLVRLAKRSVLAILRLHLLGHPGRDAHARTVVDIGPLDPVVRGLGCSADLRRDRYGRQPDPAHELDLPTHPTRFRSTVTSATLGALIGPRPRSASLPPPKSARMRPPMHLPN
jgi:hypothetical protein